LNIARRIENQTGVLGSTITGGKVEFSVFAPLEFESTKTQIEQVIQTFGAQTCTNEDVKEAQAKARAKRKLK
jgi:hypothetical protein